MNKSAEQFMLLIKILKIFKINFRKPFSTKTYPMEQQYLYKHPSHPIACLAAFLWKTMNIFWNQIKESAQIYW